MLTMDERKIRRFSLTLYSNNPLHMAAMEQLEKIPKGWRTDFVCNRILMKESHGNTSPNTFDWRFAEASKQAVSPPVQQPVEPIQEPEQNDDRAKEIDENFFGFLKTLQVFEE